MQAIKLVLWEPGRQARVVEVEPVLGSSWLGAYQKLVGGYIEVVLSLAPGQALPNHGVVLVGNEDGRRLKLPLNRIRHDGEPLVGALFAAKVVTTAEGQDFSGFEDELELKRATAAVERWTEPA
jgi:hypothetical protein